MKNLHYIFFLLVLIWSCDDSANYPFQGRDAVHFQLETEDYYWTRTLDSMVYSFAGKGVTEDTLWVRVDLEGNITPEPRSFVVVVDEEQTTAEVGLHYEALLPKYELPGNTTSTRVPIIIYSKDEELENKQVVITLALKPSEQLELGIADRLSCRLIVSNMLGKPVYWDNTISWDFGDYSRRKHELCIEVLGIDFPLEVSEYSEQGSMWEVYGLYMSNYFEENYPIYDENDAIIEPW